MNRDLVQRPHCAPLPDAEEMTCWDSVTAREGAVSALRLMANAGEGALRCLKAAWAERKQEAGSAGPSDAPVLQGVKVLLFMGRGNNGGDAAVLARLLVREGAKALLCHPRELPPDLGSSQEAALVHLRDALAAGAPAFHLAAPDAPLPPDWEEPDIIVDGLLGTGFTPPLRPEYAALIERINALAFKTPQQGHETAGAPKFPGRLTRQAWSQGGRIAAPNRARPLVLSLDIPSGLSAADGKPSPVAMRADITITFEAPKPGLLLPAALPFTGRLLVQPVGIPLTVQAKHPPKLHVLLPGCVQAGRGPYEIAHKGRAGRVLVIGGSAGLTGAPHLSALAALRAGAGLVSIACPAGINADVKYNCPDIMTLPLGARISPLPVDWSESFAHGIMPLLPGNDAVVIGPGLGLSGGAYAFLSTLLTLCGEAEQLPPLVLDADALTVLADTPELIGSLPMASVFTPHPGEAARLLKTTVADVEADRNAAMHALMDLFPGTVLLKGAGTLIGSGNDCCFLPFIEPNLAVGGSGDVLAGIIAAYLAQGAEALPAACAGAYTHGLCGRMLREAAPLRGNLASDIAATIPRARALARKLPAHWLPGASFIES